MAYMRGDAYFWSDGGRLHLWVADGLDEWEDSGWHHADEGDEFPVQPNHLKDGHNTASGVSVPQDVMDEYVIMRLAELVESGSVASLLDRTLAKHHRPSLIANADKLKALFTP